jgi:hypothetical protein
VTVAELARVEVGVLPKRLPVALGLAPNKDALGVVVPENKELPFCAAESSGFGVPNKLPTGPFEAWLLSVGGGPAGVVEKLSVFVGAGVVDPDAALVEAGVPKLKFWIPGGLFSELAPLSSFFCPNNPLPKGVVDVFAVPKMPPVEVEELVVVVVFPPNRPLKGAPPLLPPSPKAGVFAGVVLGVELEVPNIGTC